MTLLPKERARLLNRIKRIRGQMDAVERALEEQGECADILMQLAAVRGGVNSLMAEVLEDHIRLHLVQPSRKTATPELVDDLVELVRAYLK
ncbi:MAG: metal/formaldehyde-sensitive transcriptional repressor [Acidobacteriaceae bacterium]